MAKNGFRVFDSDMHIMEPPDLWERFIAPEFRDLAPRGVTSENVRDLRIAFPPDAHDRTTFIPSGRASVMSLSVAFHRPPPPGTN